MIKLLILTHACTVGGAENHLLLLLKHLDKRKFDVTFAYFIEKPDDAGSMREEFLRLGIKVVDLKGKSKFDPLMIYRLIKTIKEEKYEIIHTHLFRANLAGLLIKKLFPSIKLISTVHNVTPKGERKFIKLFARLIGRNAEMNIAISDAVKEYLANIIRVPSNKIKKIYYGLEPPQEVSAEVNIRHLCDIPKDYSIVGMIARYAPQKGHLYILRAMPHVIDKIPNVCLVMVGHDEKGIKEDLERTAYELGISDNTHFLRFLPNPQQLMMQFDVFILPSLWEGLGLVLLEAMSVAKPIVASNIGPIPEIVVDKKTGLLVPPKDSDALARSLIEILENKREREEMGKAGYKRWRKFFTVSQMVKETEKVYTQCL